MAVRDLSAEFGSVADLIDLADNLMRENLTRISTTEDIGYTMPHVEASQLYSLLLVTSDYASRIRRQLDDASVEAIKRFEREAGRSS